MTEDSQDDVAEVDPNDEAPKGDDIAATVAETTVAEPNDDSRQVPTDRVDATASDAGPVGKQSAKKHAKAQAKQQLKADLAEAKERNRRLRLMVIGIGVVAVLLAGSTIGFAVAHHLAVADRSSQQQAAQNRATAEDQARKAAQDYAKRALTIDYQKATDFVKGLAVGTTDSFGKTFSLEPNGAGALTKELLEQLHMVSEGDVVYAFLDGDPNVDRKPGDPWNFVVIARQTSTTTQQPERATTAVILRIVVVEINGEWKVANFAPDPKVQGGESGLIPGAG